MRAYSKGMSGSFSTDKQVQVDDYLLKRNVTASGGSWPFSDGQAADPVPA
jgi:hypothetical protein